VHYCDYCQRDFKTVQGLLGHQRMGQCVSDTPEVLGAPVSTNAVQPLSPFHYLPADEPE